LKEKNIDTENNYFKFLTSLSFSRARQHTQTYARTCAQMTSRVEISKQSFFISTLFFHKLIEK